MATPLVVRNENNVAISYEEFWHLVYNYTIPACDERTDGRTDRPPKHRQHSPHYTYTFCGKNNDSDTELYFIFAAA